MTAGDNEVLRAILELSEQINAVEGKLTQRIAGVEEKLTDRIDAVDEKLTGKIDIVDAKISVLSENLLKTQAEVKVLKDAK